MTPQEFKEQWIKQLETSMLGRQEDKEEWKAAYNKFYNKKN